MPIAITQEFYCSSNSVKLPRTFTSLTNFVFEYIFVLFVVRVMGDIMNRVHNRITASFLPVVRMNRLSAPVNRSANCSVAVVTPQRLNAGLQRAGQRVNAQQRANDEPQRNAINAEQQPTERELRSRRRQNRLQ